VAAARGSADPFPAQRWQAHRCEGIASTGLRSALVVAGPPRPRRADPRRASRTSDRPAWATARVSSAASCVERDS